MSKIGINQRLRANLIRLRMKAGFDQNALARKSGVAHVAQIESGTRPAGKQALTKLAKALDVDVSEFFLPEDFKVVKDPQERLLLDLVEALTHDGRRLLCELTIAIIRHERGKNF